MAQHEAWPNDPSWRALADGARFMAGDRLYVAEVVDCGELVLPTGQLTACDPFADLWSGPDRAIPVPPGRYPVRVTLFDVSGAADGSHHRVAYASLLLADRPEVARRVLSPGKPPAAAEGLGHGEFFGFPVDAGAACFVDGGALRYGMPTDEDWYETYFESATPNSWAAVLDDPATSATASPISRCPWRTTGRTSSCSPRTGATGTTRGSAASIATARWSPCTSTSSSRRTRKGTTRRRRRPTSRVRHRYATRPGAGWRTPMCRSQGEVTGVPPLSDAVASSHAR